MPEDYTPEEIEAAQLLAQQRAAERQQSDLRAVMSTREGRRFMHHLLYDLAGITRVGWVNDHGADSFAAGSRNLGLTMLAKLEDACLASVRLMDDEHRAESTPSA